MADHATSGALFYDGVWNTVPAMQTAGMTCRRGAPAEGQESTPSSAALGVNNESGAYNPKAAMSPLYGAAGQNTPLRITTDGSVRSMTEAASWKPRTVKGSAITGLTGGGVLRRIGQGKTPLRSPLDRAVLADADVVAYWPLADGSGSDVAASGLPGGAPMAELGDVGFATVDGPAGAVARLPEFIGSDGAWRGGLTAPVTMAATGEWSVDFWVKLATDDAASALGAALTWRVSGSWGAFLWHMRISETLITIRIDNNGDTDTDTLLGDIATFDGNWHHVRVCAQQDGSDVDAQLYVDGVVEDTGSAVGMTIGVITQVNVGDYAGLIPPKYGVPTAITSTSVGRVVVRNGGTDSAGGDYEAGTGYVGERAGVRFLRLGVEEGVTTTVVGDETDTPTMGPQQEVTFLDALRECVRTDGGMMFEPRAALGIAMRPLRTMYNQDPAITLTQGTDLEPTLEPLFDDYAKANRVTAVTPGGSQVVYEKTSGPLNIHDPVDDPDGAGVWDVRLDVNPELASTLIDHASWAVARGTVDEPRWPGIVVNLDRVPGLITALNAADLGDRVDLVGLFGRYGLDDAALVIVGEEENLPPRQRRVTLNTAPASVLEIAIVGANDGSTDLRGAAVGTDLSTLNGAILTNTTAIVIDSGGVAWTTDPDDWNASLNGGPLYVGVGGEKMQVTNITGAGSAWTITVVRSVNSVVKAHADGAPLYVWHTARVGK